VVLRRPGSDPSGGDRDVVVRRDGRRLTVVGQGVVTGTVPLTRSEGVFDATAVLARFRRRQRWARLQIPALLLGVAFGSALGAAIGAWWAEVVGGAFGYLVVVAAFA